MQTFDAYTYLNGMAIAAYFLVCLVCGLQLCFNVFNFREPNKITRLMGCVMLCWSFTGLLYIISGLVPSLQWFNWVGYTIDTLLFAGLAWSAYVLYANCLPKRRKAFLLALPYIIYAILIYCLPPSLGKWLSDVTMATLVFQYLHYARALHRHESELGDLYSDQDSHSLRWLLTVVVLYVVWWVLHDIFNIDNLRLWLDIVSYTYMAGFILFVYSKVCNYRQPVSVETQVSIEQVNNNDVSVVIDDIKPLQKALVQLMEEKQIYLNQNLSLDDVVKELDTNAKYLHAVLRDDMHTNFCQFVNTYRVEHAKEMLRNTNHKVGVVAEQSGFNSSSVFYRVFLKATGKTPSEWRKN